MPLGLEFKAGLQTELNFKHLKSLNCFWKCEEGLEKFGIS